MVADLDASNRVSLALSEGLDPILAHFPLRMRGALHSTAAGVTPFA